MNLKLTQQLLATADRRGGTLHVQGDEAAREVQLMKDAGLVIASANLCGVDSYAEITELTEAGRKLLRVLDAPPTTATYPPH